MSKDMGVAAGAAPFDDVAEAMAWLGMWSAENRGHMVPIHDAPKHIRTLKAMLAEPRLPKEPNADALTEMFQAAHRQNAGLCRFGMASAYRALYAHLTKPATKTVEVWRLEYTFQREPRIQQFDTQQEASYKAECLTLGDPNSHHACIRVTGPHTQSIPA